MIEIIYFLAPPILAAIGMIIGSFIVGYATGRLSQAPPSSSMADHIIRTTGKH